MLVMSMKPCHLTLLYRATIDFMQTKSELRQHHLELRRSLSAKERAHASRMICRQVEQQIDWSIVQTAHIYTSSQALDEVDTSFLLDYVQAEQPHTTITTSPASPDAPLPSEQFDLVIVPVVAFDTKLHRLGMGGGWYDRFLATQSHPVAVGLAYSIQFTESLPYEPHDIPLQAISTESLYYTAKNPPSTAS